MNLTTEFANLTIQLNLTDLTFLFYQALENKLTLMLKPVHIYLLEYIMELRPSCV